MQSQMKKLLLIFSTCSAAYLLLLVSLYMNGRLSARGFGIGGLLLWVVGIPTFMVFFRRVNRKFPQPAEIDAAALDRLRKSAGAQKRHLAFLLCGFIYGLWETRGDATGPRIIGTIIALIFIGIYVKAIRDTQRRVQSAEAQGAVNADLKSEPIPPRENSW
jgi:Na+/melibiose symporter-like transporter